MNRRLVVALFMVVLAWGGLAAALAAGITPRLGLDLRGGTSVILTAPEGTDEALVQTAVDIMRRRIEDFGDVQEPEISISGGTSVLVNLPGVTDQARALDAIGQTGELSFRPVYAQDVISPLLVEQLLRETPEATEDVDGAAPDADDTDAETTDSTTAGGEPDDSDADSTTSTTDAPTTTLPPFEFPEGVDPDTGITIADDPDLDRAWLAEFNEEGQQIGVYEVGPSALGGSDVADALALFGQSVSGGWTVQLNLTDDGADKFAAVTAVLAGEPFGSPTRQLAIVLDGVVVAAPNVAQDVSPAEGITGGTAVITLGGEEQEAFDLATVLRYGSLPVAFERSSVQKVSATLGSDALNAGLIAGIGGLIAVILFLLFFYRALGLVTLLGLTVFGSLLILLFALLGEFQGLTLTLAGVAGVIVSVGITADSYIVFFERVKEELGKGRTVPDATDAAFTAAFRTILTADFVSLMGAVLLWALSVGAVKGFALALGVATVLDVVVARYFTKNLVGVLARSRFAEGGRFTIRAASGQEVPA